MLDLKLATAIRRMECVDIPTYINGQQATEMDLFLLECKAKLGLVHINAYANKLGIFYVTL